MYLVAIHVPLYRIGGELLLAGEWLRALELLRDSFGGRFGHLQVVAPVVDCRSVDEIPGAPANLPESESDIRFTPSIGLPVRARHYWLRERKKWASDIRRHLTQADVVHGGCEQIYRPMNIVCIAQAHKHRITSVLVRDTDTVLQMRDAAQGKGLIRETRANLETHAFNYLMRWGVQRASLSLLKGRSLFDRYRSVARNPRLFHDTSYSRHNIVPAPEVQEKIDRLSGSPGPRFVYAGRLVPRKGVDHSVRIIAALRERNIEAHFDVIGDGPESASLRELAETLGVGRHVHFHGFRPYDSRFLASLRSYHGLLFTPRYEDTPRMIFDAYAAGLPLIAYGIPYAAERIQEDRCGLKLPHLDPQGAADVIAEAWRHPTRWAEMIRQTRPAAEYHCAESWYERRAQWTIEAWERNQREWAAR